MSAAFVNTRLPSRSPQIMSFGVTVSATCLLPSWLHRPCGLAPPSSARSTMKDPVRLLRQDCCAARRRGAWWGLVGGWAGGVGRQKTVGLVEHDPGIEELAAGKAPDRIHCRAIRWSSSEPVCSGRDAATKAGWRP